MILYKTPSLVIFQILCGLAFCIYQFNLTLLLERFGGICKCKNLASLVNEIVFNLLLSYFALFFFHEEAHIFILSHKNNVS